VKKLTKEDFTAKQTATVETVETPRGTAYVRVMGASRRELYLDMLRRTGSDDKVAVGGLLAAYALCDEDGTYLFDDPTPAEIVAVSEQSWDLTNDVRDVAARLNGFTAESKAASKNGSSSQSVVASTSSASPSERPDASSSTH
jgi:hypothetical protein